MFASKRVSARQNVSYKTNLRMKKVKAFTDDRWELLHEYSSNRVERLKCFQCSKTWNKGFTVDIYILSVANTSCHLESWALLNQSKQCSRG